MKWQEFEDSTSVTVDSTGHKTERGMKTRILLLVAKGKVKARIVFHYIHCLLQTLYRTGYL
jgi:hypothetical protein